ncbi:hypothetical protein V3C99_014728 [Haemonchus contortus]|uniref:Transmembrane protein n=1 Tax=Haemonchus contortus TaxID=6289 RepID=A0A7I4YVT5_HAECO
MARYFSFPLLLVVALLMVCSMIPSVTSDSPKSKRFVKI